MPEKVQDEIARLVLTFTHQGSESFELTPEEDESMRVSREQAARGEFATDEEVQAVWARYGF